MMELQLLGVLQDLGTPYASLYINKDNVLFIGLKVESVDSCVFKSLLINVSLHDINDYFDGEIGLKQIANNATKRYIWSRKKGTQGTLLNICQQELIDNIELRKCMGRESRKNSYNYSKEKISKQWFDFLDKKVFYI